MLFKRKEILHPPPSHDVTLLSKTNYLIRTEKNKQKKTYSFGASVVQVVEQVVNCWTVAVVHKS